MARPRAAFLLATALLLATAEARANEPLRMDLVAPRTIRLDGIPREWPSPLRPLDALPPGKPRPAEADLRARAAIAYDDTNLYLAFDIQDDRLVRTKGCPKTDDHASFHIVFPKASGGYSKYEISLFPGDPGKLPGCVKTSSGQVIKSAKIVEAPKEGGYSFEASIPWAIFPEASKTRVALRGALLYHDSDGRGAQKSLGTSSRTGLSELPSLLTEPEQSLKEGLLRKHSLADHPAYDIVADIAGDGMNERVLVYDNWLVVLGPRFREGKEYFFADLGASAQKGQIPRFEAKQFSGRAKAEILIEKRIGSQASYREMIEVLGFAAGERLSSLFRHEVGIQTPQGRIRNTVRVIPDGDKFALEILPGAVNGYTAADYKEPIERSFDSMLFPWGAIKSRRFAWDGQSFAKIHEESQAPTAVTQPAIAKPSPAPRPPNPDELQDRVYALYRRDRGVPNAKPRFDLAVDVAGSESRERVLLHGRDLVVFGPSYKGGSGYSYLTLQQFANEKDILELQARDLTGDGKAEIIVRGVVFADAGEGERVEREVFLVYKEQQGQLARIFAAETARSIGKNRVAGQLSFPSGTIQVRAGRAIGWDERSYPFAQDEAPVGGIEPLILPWSGKGTVTYRYNGTAFVR